MLAQLTSRQFEECKAYAAIEPFGEYRQELRHGQQMALTANLNRDSGKKPDPYTPADFMNFLGDGPKKQKAETPEETEARLDREFGLG